VLVEISGDPARTHGQRLPADLVRALREAHTRLEEIDLLAVAAGPGSFTGLRVGIATVQGLAFARGLNVVPVSTLDALASASAQDPERPPLIGAWMDAQRGEVFSTLYGSGVRAVLPASAATPLDTLAAWRAAIGQEQVLFAGDGALRYRDVIATALGTQARFLARVSALAGIIGRMAARTPERAVTPHALVPLYIRRSDAELARDRGHTR